MRKTVEPNFGLDWGTNDIRQTGKESARSVKSAILKAEKAERKAVKREAKADRKAAKREAKAERNAAQREAKADIRTAKDEAKIGRKAAQREAKADIRAAKDEAKAERRVAQREAKADIRAAKDEAKIERNAAQREAKADIRAAKDEARAERKVAKSETKAERCAVKNNAKVEEWAYKDTSDEGRTFGIGSGAGQRIVKNDPEAERQTPESAFAESQVYKHSFDQGIATSSAFETDGRTIKKAYRLNKRASEKAFKSNRRASKKTFKANRRASKKAFKIDRKASNNAYKADKRAAKKAYKADSRTAKKVRKARRTPLQKGLMFAVRFAALALVIALFVITFKYVDVIVNRPADAFFTPKPIATPGPVDTGITSRPSIDPSMEPVDMLDIYEKYESMADRNIITDGILNVLLIGVDYADERVEEDWAGKNDFHADVMMVLAINFNENTVDMISLPRDTYANIPGVEGIYKLNASIDCGGGMNDGGYQKVCESAEWMLGGIPIHYYYAVTMPTVKRLGNIVGGLDYEVEMDFTMAGRSYQAGMQHLDGQGILDYLRVRKGVDESGDLNRVNRQKRMLIALFNAMKKSNKLLLIPEILSAFGDDVATNTTLQQSMALTLWALDLGTDDIGMYSIDGSLNSVFGWNFCLTDQQNRVDVIKEVYGVDVEQYRTYTRDYAHFRWQTMLSDQALATTDGLIAEIENILGDYLITPIPGREASTPTPESASMSAAAPKSPFQQAHYDAYSSVVRAHNGLLSAYGNASELAQRFVQGEDVELYSAAKTLESARAEYVNAVKNAAAVFGINRSFDWNVQYWLDPDFNEVIVDFR